MAECTPKSGSIWVNIGEVMSQIGILGHSCYQCALFYDSYRMTPQTLILSEQGVTDSLLFLNGLSA